MTQTTAPRRARVAPRTPPPHVAPWRGAPLAAAFLLSGASALYYELLWVRILGQILGSTAAATATLLSAYMFGLGLGAWILGRLSDRMERGLATAYVAVECGIAAYGLLSRFLFDRGALLYEVAYHWSAGAGGRLLAARFAVSFVLVAAPTVLMGGTFPLMVRLVRVRGEDDGHAAGRAYAANTAGAAIGVLSLPMVVLPAVGVTWSLALAACGNLAAAGIVWLWSRRAALSGAASGPASPHQGDRGAVATVPLLAAFFLSSFASLALETVWTRHLGILFGGQVHTFAFVLFAYLTGLFAGGALFARLLARFGAVRLLVAALALAALSVAISLPLLAGGVMLAQVRLMLQLGPSYGTFLGASAAVIFALIFPVAVGFGIAFPAIIDLLSRSGVSTGASVALTYAVNTLGTTIGAAAAGFVLVPAVGTQRTLEMSVVLLAVSILLTMLATRRQAVPRPAWRLALPAVLLVVLVLPRWDWNLAHAGYAKSPLSFLQRYLAGLDFSGRKMLALYEGATATVAVRDVMGDRSLCINGKSDASTGAPDMLQQTLVGLLPPLFVAEPKRALVVGLGSGVTANSLLAYPVETLECAELSPEVIEAARRFFGDVNGGLFSDPRLHLHADDGRNYLHFQPPGTYDLIVSQPSNPWISGQSALFTDDYFADLRDKLRAGGVAAVWFHNYDMSFDHLKMVTRTFRRRFPESIVFVIGGRILTNDILMLGSKSSFRMAHAPESPALSQRARSLLAETGNGQLQALMGGLVATPGSDGPFDGDFEVNSDDRPLLEFRAPADRFLEGIADRNRMMLLKDMIFLPLAPGPAEVPAERSLAEDGFRPPLPLPPGDERRGIFAFTHVDDAGEWRRWVLVGRRFETRDGSTGLFQSQSKAADPSSIAREVSALVSAAGSPSGMGSLAVNGHAAFWADGTISGQRVVAIGWRCPVHERTYFVVRRAADPDARAGAAVAAALAAAFPCDDEARR